MFRRDGYEIVVGSGFDAQLDVRITRGTFHDLRHSFRLVVAHADEHLADGDAARAFESNAAAKTN